MLIADGDGDGFDVLLLTLILFISKANDVSLLHHVALTAGRLP